jgi:hypothetical protein
MLIELDMVPRSGLAELKPGQTPKKLDTENLETCVSGNFPIPPSQRSIIICVCTAKVPHELTITFVNEKHYQNGNRRVD